ARGGGFAVVARQCVAEVHAADRGRRAEVGRADVGVVAVRRGAEAGAEGARVADRADVAVGAGNRVEAQEPTRPGTVAGVVGADAGGGAGRAERLERARRGAAVAGQLVAVVALLARVEDPVATDVDRLAGDGEQIRLHAAGEEPWPVHLEEVGAAGAPGDGVGGEPVTDEAGGRSRIPREEGRADRPRERERERTREKRDRYRADCHRVVDDAEG